MKDSKVLWPIDKLHEWEKNPRNITEQGFNRLKYQIKKLGMYKPLLITPDGEVLGGNMRLKAYRELGIKEAWVSIVEPKDENEKMEYSLSDNDRAGYYDEDLLANLTSTIDIDWSKYSIDLKEPTNLQDLLDQFKEVTEDEVPEVPEEAISKLGEVYQLGRHRLMCGDSTKIEDVEKLMNGQKADMLFTDPPYGINLIKGEVNGIGGGGELGFTHGKLSPKQRSTTMVDRKLYRRIEGDDKPFDPTFLLSMAKRCFIYGANNFSDKLPVSPHWLVWDKKNEGAERRNTFSDAELIWTNVNGVSVKIYRWNWNGITRKGDRKSELITRCHPTQKPVGLSVEIIRDYSEQDDIILDLFGGSGSTLIACEQTNRTCYMMELDPKYCDVIRKRYDNFIAKQ